MSEKHISELEKLCRVCGAHLHKGKSARKYVCAKYQADLYEIFSIDIRLDELHKHPTKFCHPWKNKLHSIKKALQEGREMQTNKTVYDWEDHKQQNCPICSPPPLKAGRHKKKPNMGGRPKNISYQGAMKHVKAIAPPPISNYNTLVTDTPPD